MLLVPAVRENGTCQKRGGELRITNGLTRKSGCTTPDANEEAVKAAAMEQCRECYVLCDSSKFDNISSVTFADFYRSTIITDRIPSGYEDCANIIEVQKEQK